MKSRASRPDTISADHGLTRRERECLAHLGSGLTTGETAATLGISRSTLDAHLMSARRKLGVRSTAQALLTLERDRADDQSGRPPTGPIDPSLSKEQAALVDRLAHSNSFDEAWRALHKYAGTLGITAITFGVNADPAGTLDERSYSIWSSLPDELMRIYDEMGGAPADPAARHVTRSTQPSIVDPEYLGKSLAVFPPAVRAMANALIDTHLNRQLCVPHRDPATGAALSLSFSFDIRRRREFESTIAARGPELAQATGIFWDGVQRGRLIAGARGLTERQRQTLRLLARGFSLVEMAEHMNLSLRSVENCLAGARAKLGAKTNAQSLYRAMVYRALA